MGKENKPFSLTARRNLSFASRQYRYVVRDEAGRATEGSTEHNDPEDAILEGVRHHLLDHFGKEVPELLIKFDRHRE